MSVLAWYLVVALVNFPAVPPTALPVVVPNDNRVAANIERNGRQELELHALTGEWYPEGPKGPKLSVWTFAGTNDEPRIPGPMLRVTAGTRVRITLRNDLTDTLAFHLPPAFIPADSGKGTQVAPKSTRTIDVTPSVVGSHFYWAAKPGVSFDSRGWDDGHLLGAFVVDPRVGARTSDRVFVITESFRFDKRDVVSQLAINGLSWPHTERLAASVGDSLHWRWINGTALEHPMHLHGFYFRVEGHSKGDGRFVRVRPDSQPLVVTELMRGGTTMDVSFKPTEPGNWVMHCHFAMHVNGVVSTDSAYRDIEKRSLYEIDGRHMAGLVMGLSVSSPTPTADHAATRHFRLLMGPKATPFYFGSQGFAFVKHEGGAEPDSTAYRVPGPPLILKRNERVAITLVNRLKKPTAVHWHGLEIESFPDGVPHWSGRDSKILHPIAAGDSFAINFAPPRNGTFIYHSHFNEAGQINGGLYGGIIVVDDPAKLDTTRDHLLVIGGGGVPQVAMGTESPWGLVNGLRFPSLNLKVGQTHRLRFVSIHIDWKIKVGMDGDTGGLRWRPVAKDGADLPAALRRLQPIFWEAGPGETADFEVVPAREGNFTLLVRSADAGWHVPVTLRVTK